MFYQHDDKNGYYLLGTHVDDIISTTNSVLLHTKLSSALNAAYGPMPWAAESIEYLGMHLQQNPDHSVTADIAATTKNALLKFSEQIPTTRANYPSDIDLFKTIDISDGVLPKEEDVSLYRSIVMTLMYLTNVRVDILKEVMLYSKYCHRPTPNAWKYLRLTLAYLQQHPYFCVNFGADSLEVHGYSDSSLANLPNARSQGCMFVTLGKNGGPISYDARGITEIVQSIAEGELKKFGDAAKECIMLCKLLTSIGLSNKSTFNLLCDNKSSLCLAKLGEGMTTKSRHFNIQFHFLKELIDTGTLIPEYIATAENISDIGTKPIVGSDFYRQITRLMYHGDIDGFDRATKATKSRLEAKTTSAEVKIVSKK